MTWRQPALVSMTQPGGGLERGSSACPSTAVKPKYLNADAASANDAADIALLSARMQVVSETVHAKKAEAQMRNPRQKQSALLGNSCLAFLTSRVTLIQSLLPLIDHLHDFLCKSLCDSLCRNEKVKSVACLDMLRTPAPHAEPYTYSGI